MGFKSPVQDRKFTAISTPNESFKGDEIDSKRMIVHVHRGKGAEDRMVPLPNTTILSLCVFLVLVRAFK